jgi:hypothetical protein
MPTETKIDVCSMERQNCARNETVIGISYTCVSCANPSYGNTGEQTPIVKTSYMKLTRMPLDSCQCYTLRV